VPRKGGKMKMFKFIFYIATPLLLLICAAVTWFFRIHNMNAMMLGTLGMIMGLAGFVVIGISAFKMFIEKKKSQ